MPVLSLMILRKKFVPSYLFSFKLHCREGSCPLRERSRYCNVNLLPAASFFHSEAPRRWKTSGALPANIGWKVRRAAGQGVPGSWGLLLGYDAIILVAKQCVKRILHIAGI